MKRGLGWRPDPHDPRDLRYGVDLGAGDDEEPPDECLDMLGSVGSILDQGDAQACTGTSAGGAYRAKLTADGLPARLPSALWLWTLGRKAIGEERYNSGCYLRSVLKGAYDLGWCPEERWPSGDMGRDFARDPSDDPRTFRSAFDARAFGYYRVTGPSQDSIARSVKQAIWRGRPVVFGTQVSEAWCWLGRHDQPIGPPRAQDVAGGHAMYWIGYTRDAAIAVNSYGESFGNDGLWLMRWDYVVDPMTSDRWAIERVERLAR